MCFSLTASSVYTVAIAAVTGTVAVVALRNTVHYNEVYIIMSVIVFVATTVTVSLAMLPKVGYHHLNI